MQRRNGPVFPTPSRRWLAFLVFVAMVVLFPPVPLARIVDTWSRGDFGDALLGVLALKIALIVLVATAGWVSWIVPAENPAGRAPAAAPPMSRWAARTLLVVLAAGVALRLLHLESGLWLDEIDTLLRDVRAPLTQIVTSYDSQNQHILYSVLARLSILIFGESAWSLRLPAAALGIASLWATWRFAREVAGEREALAATALLAVSYHHVWFSQNARGYTGLLLLTLVASTAFLRLWRGSSPHPRSEVWRYAIAAALAVYLHVTAALVVAAHALIALLLGLSGRRPLRSYGPVVSAMTLATALSLTLYALVLPQFIDVIAQPTMEGVAVAWRTGRWMTAETIRGLAKGVPGGFPALVVGLVALGIGAASYWRRQRDVALVMLLPVTVTVVALLVLRHNLWPRFFFFTASFATIVAVRGGFVAMRAIFRRRGEEVALIGVAFVAVASALTVPRAWRAKQDFEGAARFLEQAHAAADVVLTTDITQFVYSRYRRLDSRAVATAAQLEVEEDTHARSWLVYTFPVRLQAVEPDLWRRLETQYRVVRIFPGTVGGGDVIVVTRPPFKSGQ